MYTVVKAGDITSLDIDTPILEQRNFSTVERAYAWIDKDRCNEGILDDISAILRASRVKRVNSKHLSYTLVKTSI